MLWRREFDGKWGSMSGRHHNSMSMTTSVMHPIPMSAAMMQAISMVGYRDADRSILMYVSHWVAHAKTVWLADVSMAISIVSI